MKKEAKKPNSLTAKIKGFVVRNKATIVAVLCCVLVMGIVESGVVFAGETGTAGTGAAVAADASEQLWQTLMNLIKKWVTRLGAVIMFVGGIQFGMGWKSDDAEQKTRGLNTIISGAIVMGVAAITSVFFA